MTYPNKIAYHMSHKSYKNRVGVNSELAVVDLTALREAAGLAARELARELDVNHAAVLKWERTDRITKTEFLVPMASLLGATCATP
jgi:DNA-binding transcriptional regulator YiaG